MIHVKIGLRPAVPIQHLTGITTLRKHRIKAAGTRGGDNRPAGSRGGGNRPADSPVGARGRRRPNRKAVAGKAVTGRPIKLPAAHLTSSPCSPIGRESSRCAAYVWQNFWTAPLRLARTGGG